VVDAGRAELDGEPHPGAGGELVPVHPEPEAGIAPGLEHGTRFVAVEGVRARRLAEDVDPAGLGGAGREHLAGDQLDVGGALRAGGTTWAPRNVVSSVHSRASRNSRSSSTTVRP